MDMAFQWLSVPPSLRFATEVTIGEIQDRNHWEKGNAVSGLFNKVAIPS